MEESNKKSLLGTNIPPGLQSFLDQGGKVPQEKTSEEITSSESSFTEQYLDYLKGISVNQDEAQQNLARNGIYCRPQRTFSRANTGLCRDTLEVLSVEGSNNFQIISMIVAVGLFETQITILNVLDTSKTHTFLYERGSYGRIYALSHPKSGNKEQQLSIIKCVRVWYDEKKQDRFTAYQSTLREVICQVAYCKISSALEIGSKFKTIQGFDLVCYQTCIEFCQEFCEEICNAGSCYTIEKLQTTLKQGIKTYHSLNIVHRDIKQANIMYSPFFKKFVFIDFGSMIQIKEEIGFETLTMFCGTFSNATEQMKKLLTSNTPVKGWCDLYQNDLGCIRETIKKLKKTNLKKEMHGRIFPVNQVWHLFRFKYLLFRGIRVSKKELDLAIIMKSFLLEVLAFMFEIPHNKNHLEFYTEKMYFSPDQYHSKSPDEEIATVHQEKVKIFKPRFRQISAFVGQDFSRLSRVYIKRQLKNILVDCSGLPLEKESFYYLLAMTNSDFNLKEKRECTRNFILPTTQKLKFIKKSFFFEDSNACPSEQQIFFPNKIQRRLYLASEKQFIKAYLTGDELQQQLDFRRGLSLVTEIIGSFSDRLLQTECLELLHPLYLTLIFPKSYELNRTLEHLLDIYDTTSQHNKFIDSIARIVILFYLDPQNQSNEVVIKLLQTKLKVKDEQIHKEYILDEKMFSESFKLEFLQYRILLTFQLLNYLYLPYGLQRERILEPGSCNSRQLKQKDASMYRLSEILIKSQLGILEGFVIIFLYSNLGVIKSESFSIDRIKLSFQNLVRRCNSSINCKILSIKMKIRELSLSPAHSANFKDLKIIFRKQFQSEQAFLIFTSKEFSSNWWKIDYVMPLKESFKILKIYRSLDTQYLNSINMIFNSINAIAAASLQNKIQYSTSFKKELQWLRKTIFSPDFYDQTEHKPQTRIHNVFNFIFSFPSANSNQVNSLMDDIAEISQIMKAKMPKFQLLIELISLKAKAHLFERRSLIIKSLLAEKQNYILKPSELESRIHLQQQIVNQIESMAEYWNAYWQILAKNSDKIYRRISDQDLAYSKRKELLLITDKINILMTKRVGTPYPYQEAIRQLHLKENKLISEILYHTRLGYSQEAIGLIYLQPQTQHELLRKFQQSDVELWDDEQIDNIFFFVRCKCNHFMKYQKNYSSDVRFIYFVPTYMKNLTVKKTITHYIYQNSGKTIASADYKLENIKKCLLFVNQKKYYNDDSQFKDIVLINSLLLKELSRWPEEPIHSLIQPKYYINVAIGLFLLPPIIKQRILENHYREVLLLKINQNPRYSRFLVKKSRIFIKKQLNEEISRLERHSNEAQKFYRLILLRKVKKYYFKHQSNSNSHIFWK